MIDDQKKEYDKLSYTYIILYLSDFVLRKVGKHDSTKRVGRTLLDIIDA